MARYNAAEHRQDMLGDLSPDLFRKYGHQIVEWVATYLEHPERYPVLSQVNPGEIQDSLPASPPDLAETMDTILQDFEDIIVPGVTHWNHPGFFAYFAITGSAPGILAEFLTAALNANAMLWRTSPAATELEMVTLDWLRQLLGLPKSFEGVMYDTASISSLVAIAAARESAGFDIRHQGMLGRQNTPRLRLYCSEQAHSSIDKAAITLGIGQEGVRKIETDEDFRMNSALLRAAIQEDREAGWFPFCVVATVGTTSTTSIDDVTSIADICTEYGLWLHVDAAYGGIAAIVPEMRWVLEGVDRADSLVVNPHKWLFTPIDLSAFYSPQLDVVKKAFSLVPEYLRTDDNDEVRNYMDYGPQLGRRFRSLKLWFVLRSFGKTGIIERLRHHMRLAHQFALWVAATPGWELLAPTPFSTVCFRARPDGLSESEVDGLNQALLDSVNASGEVFLSSTRLNGRFTLRLAIGNLRSQAQDVERAWKLLQVAFAEAQEASA